MLGLPETIIRLSQAAEVVGYVLKRDLVLLEKLQISPFALPEELEPGVEETRRPLEQPSKHGLPVIQASHTGPTRCAL
jgi:hypothetical protein